MAKFELGETVRDIITGFQGVITGHVDYITGCDQYILQPKAKDKKTTSDALWVDEDRLQKVKAKKVVIKRNSQKPGAGIPAPIK